MSDSLGDQLKRDKAKKSAAISKMLRVTTGGRGGSLEIGEYLEASSGIEADEYAAGCELLCDTWTNTFAAPMPGHIRDAANRFAQKSRSEIEIEQQRLRNQRAYEDRMTPAKIRAELENPQFTDPNPVIEAKRIGMLRRVLANMDSSQPQRQPAKVQPRGDANLQRFDYAEIL